MASSSADALAPWSGYFKKSVAERHALLESVAADVETKALASGGLEFAVANNMIENCVGVLSLPLGVAPTFVVNGAHFVVPFCVEEPSVIAAASGAAKLFAENGGFAAESTPNIMTGEIQVLDVAADQLQGAVARVAARKEELIARANAFCEKMRARGGGVKDVAAHILRPRSAQRRVCGAEYLVVHVQIDVCEAMGANIVNTVCEGLAPFLVEVTGGRAGLRILTNLCPLRKTKASFKLPVAKLGWKGVDGSEVADRILEALYFAQDDVNRATTHNKGIMNGIDAVAIATGQDWRAIEAGAHAFAASSGVYQPLTHYELQGAGDEALLVGSIELPLAVGTVGGALQSHPLYRFTHALLKHPNAQTLSQIIAAVGLAQNFAAIRALAVEGIQKGHMALHAKNVATGAGVPTEAVAEVAAFLVKSGKINAEAALEYWNRSKTASAQANSTHSNL